TTPRSMTCSSRSRAGSCAMNDHPLYQLTLARMREFYREPEAIFWVFGFPIVLAFALGLAFRNSGPGELKVGVAAGAGGRALAAVRDERIVEAGSRYSDFLIPGLLGMNLLGSGIWGVGFSVVQARQKKLLKRFMATPMRRSHYLLGFILSRLVFLFVEVIALVGFGWWMFAVGVRGSFGAVAFITVLGALSFAGLGMLVASRARTIEAVS